MNAATNTVTIPSVPIELAAQGRAVKNTSTGLRRKREMRNLLKRGRIWYFKKMVHGSVAYVSLETEDLDLAKAKRDENLRKAGREELQKIKGPRSQAATIGQVLTAYEAGAKTITERIEDGTVTRNLAAARNFLRWAFGANGRREDALKVDELKVELMTPDLVAKFKANYVSAAGADRVAQEERRRGAASVLRQMRSVFSAQSQLLYRGLAMPALQDFLQAAKMEFEQRVHLPIANDVLQGMHAAIEEIRSADPKSPLWLVHALHKFCGLRNEEIAEARVEWFCRAPWGQVFLSVVTRPYYEPKGSQGHVPIASEVARLLAPFVQDKEPGDHLVSAPTLTDRQNLIYREHAAWIRNFLPADRYAKAGYELRRWAAQVMETRYGRDAAEAFLRHSPKTVAERHYFERWYPWRRAGLDVGVTLEDVRGVTEDKIANVWVQGAAALCDLPVAPLAKN